jgi:glycosyltransferase involved in cell wall biosynthesis
MKSIYYWSPCLEKVGTYKSTIHSAISLANYSEHNKIKIINSCGEWNEKKNFLNKNNVEVVNFGFDYFKYLPKTGYLSSRFSYLIIFLTSLIPLLRILTKEKPDYLVIHLITSLPLFLNLVTKTKTKIILRISGFPKLNYFRKFFWKLSGRKIYKVTCPSIELRKQILEYNLFAKNKVLFLADPIIRIKEFINKVSKNNKSKKIFYERKFFISVGRLTKQKNFNYLLNEFSDFVGENKNFDLLIFGIGKDKQKLEKIINRKNLQSNVKLMGYSKNIFQYMKDAEAFILSSLWEDPGFVLIESAMCNLFIISSNCKNGPEEILLNGKGGLLFESNQKGALKKKLDLFLNLKEEKNKMKLITKKNILKYTLFRHFKIFEKILS